MSFTAEIKNDLNGLGILRDWVGDGLRPVSEELSESRAALCVKCQFNHRGDWWDSAKSVIADTIRAQIAVKHKLKVQTTYDNNLGTCKVCSCNLPLKVHIPISHLKDSIDAEELSAMPDFCWIKKEITT